MMKIHVLGPNCDKCNEMAENVRQAVEQLKIEYELVKVTDLLEIMKFGVMMPPALVVNGQVKVVGNVPTIVEIKRMLS